MFDKILIAVDSSACSQQAVSQGLSLAEKLGARVGIISVIDVSKALNRPDAGISHAEALSNLKEEAFQIVSRIKSEYPTVQFDELFPEGHPIEEILKAIEDWSADLVVMGTHGFKGIEHLLLGSVAENVVRRSPVPVMTVRMKR